MSSSKATRAAALLVVLPLAGWACAAPRHPATAAPAPTCPATRDGAPLAAVSVFDGPLDEHADLVPDGETTVRGSTVTRWNVAYVYQAGRVVHASCRYGSGAPVDVPLTQPVRACRLTETRGTRSLSCR